MKSLRNLSKEPTALPLVADDVTELHAARLLLLLRLCGTSGRIEGLTKLAKLDFFVRYPAFFRRVVLHLEKSTSVTTGEVDSEMVRHHYGPWDKRYYSVLPFLESRRLIKVSKELNTYVFSLTDLGLNVAKRLEKLVEFGEQVSRMREVKRLLASKNGSALKQLVYEVFEEEVAKKPLGDMIQ
jgi:DNA-binding PadR family transcriptional regulator